MPNYIESTSEDILECAECRENYLRKTYKVGSNHYCKTCACRKAFGKASGVPLCLMDYIDPNMDYELYLNRARDILLNGQGTMKHRAMCAKKCIPDIFIIRKITKTRYVILCPIGRLFVEAPQSTEAKELPYIDPKNPFKSICAHVQERINNGLPIQDVAEYIWSIRGEYDYITAMMYPEQSKVIMTWPKGQKELYIT